jgi:uncharacterized membrane protein YiaA
MKRKKIVGLVILVIGVVLFIFALSAKHKIANAKAGAGAVTGLLPKNAFGSYASGEIKEATGQYDTLVQVIFLGGIGLMIIGGVMTFFMRNKN